jgi:hypothetical protein
MMWRALTPGPYDEVVAYGGEWPARMFVGFGGKEYTEYSGTRNNGRDFVDRLLVGYVERFVNTLRDKGRAVQVDPGCRGLHSRIPNDEYPFDFVHTCRDSPEFYSHSSLIRPDTRTRQPLHG